MTITTHTILNSASVGLAVLMFACIPQEGIDDGGSGGAGGDRTDGGHLADAGGGGGGGEGGVACDECACPEIEDAAACEDRADCAARYDVFGEFADCRDAGDAMCRSLDEAQCDAREDCEWGADGCGEAPVECADHGDAGACVEGGCFWWADQCNEDRQPRRCDQPDPASCEAANCEWTARGCREPLPGCDELAQPACMAREACRWVGGACQDDPGHQACEALGEEQCLIRGDCGWSANGCIELQHGDCRELGEAMCLARPDCTALYGDEENCDECDQRFLGCEVAAVDCRNVPVDACERTPGCVLDGDPNCNCPPDADCDCENLRCVDVEVGPCENLDPAMCARDARCQLEEVEVCDDGGRGMGGADAGGAEGDADGAGFRAPPEEDEPIGPEPPPPCRVEVLCVERDRACEALPPEECWDDERCELIQDDCECEAPDPLPCDCDGDEDCVCAQPVPPCDCGAVCQPRQGGQQCEELGPEQCFERGDCEWFEDDGGVCECFIDEAGEEICACEAPGGWCGEAEGDQCADLQPDACADNVECVLEWVDPPCHCDPDRDPDCDDGCEPVPFCHDAWAFCGRQNADGCADHEACVWWEDQICDGGGEIPPECAEDGDCIDLPPPPPEPEPPVCEDVAECIPAAWADGGDGGGGEPGEPGEGGEADPEPEFFP